MYSDDLFSEEEKNEIFKEMFSLLEDLYNPELDEHIDKYYVFELTLLETFSLNRNTYNKAHKDYFVDRNDLKVIHAMELKIKNKLNISIKTVSLEEFKNIFKNSGDFMSTQIKIDNSEFTGKKKHKIDFINKRLSYLEVYHN
jgi:hypothetical protein